MILRLVLALVILLCATAARAQDSWSTTFAPAKFSLSNSNLTATATAHNATDTIISLVGHTKGIYYFELKAGNGSGHDLSWGLSPASQLNNIQNWIGNNSNQYGVAYHGFSAHTWNSDSNSAVPPPLATPAINSWIGFWVDLTNGLICVVDTTANPGNFFGNNAACTPSTGAGALSLSVATVRPLYLSFSSIGNGVDESVTMNTGGSAFNGAKPANAAAWNTPEIATRGIILRSPMTHQ